MSSSGAGTAAWRKSLGQVGVWVGAGAVEQDPGGFANAVTDDPNSVLSKRIKGLTLPAGGDMLRGR